MDETVIVRCTNSSPKTMVVKGLVDRRIQACIFLASLDFKNVLLVVVFIYLFIY